jgi:hypothetical protein
VGRSSTCGGARMENVAEPAMKRTRFQGLPQNVIGDRQILSENEGKCSKGKCSNR